MEKMPGMEAVCDVLVRYGMTDDAGLREGLDELGIESIEDLAGMTDGILESRLGMKLAKARRMLKELNPAEVPVTTAVGGMQGPGGMFVPAAYTNSGESLLAEVPDNEAWLEMLRCNDELMVDRGTAISACMTLVFGNINAHILPKKLAKIIKERDLERNVVAGGVYWQLLNISRKRAYSDVLAALAGGTTPGITNADRREVMGRLEDYVRSKLLRCYDAAVKIGQEVSDVATALTGTNLPDLDLLYGAAEDLRRGLNKALAGPGAVVVTDIAVNYASMNDIFSLEGLLVCCGAADQDELLNKLKIGVTSQDVRAEKSIRQFMLTMLDLKEVLPDKQLAFCLQLNQLIKKIDRRMLCGGGLALEPDGSGLGSATMLEPAGDALVSITNKPLLSENT